MSTDVLYFSFWRERFARGLTDVFEKTEKKNKTTSAYRLLELPPLLLIDIWASVFNLLQNTDLSLNVQEESSGEM